MPAHDHAETAAPKAAAPKAAAPKADESYETLSRSDVEWTPGGEPACTCGHCLICEVEALTGAGD